MERLSHYTLLEKVAGGMGVVHRARDERLDREVAIKVLPHGLLADADARAQLAKEARALSQLNHPNIATIHDFDSDAGTDFIVMEWVGGATLAERVARGAIPESELLPLAAQIAEALAYAHGLGVVHRDLKPANLRLTPEGRVKILDFGLARRTWLDEQARTLTAADATTTVGTLAYMPPEAFSGNPGDERGDLYSLGVVLYELSTGRRPFDGDNAAQLVGAILHQPLASPQTVNRAISPALEALILRLMARDPRQRPVSAREIGVTLRAGRVPPVDVGAATRPSLAVLPLENLSGDPSQEYFADGMTEALIGDLARLRELRVISRTSVMRYKGARRAITEIAAELRVENVLEGSVLRGADRLRVNVQLIDARSDTHLWAERYDRPMTDVLALQSEIARAVARAIRRTLIPKHLGTGELEAGSPLLPSIEERVSGERAAAGVGRQGPTPGGAAGSAGGLMTLSDVEKAAIVRRMGRVPRVGSPRHPLAVLLRALMPWTWFRRRTLEPHGHPVLVPSASAPAEIDPAGIRGPATTPARTAAPAPPIPAMGAAEPETAALDEIIKGTGAALPGRTVPLATAPAEASVGVRGPIANPDAYDAYLRGLQGLNQRDEGGLQRAVAHFIIATRLAPTYLPALTGLAEALAARGFWEFDPPREAYPAARLMAMRAVELDHNFGEAHAVLGYVRLHHDWNRASAEGSLMRAVELNPSNPITRLWCVNLDVASGQFERALTQARQGLELDPFSRVLRMAPGWVRFFARDYDRAAEEVIAPFRQEPGFFHAHLTRAWALLASGRRADAADSFEAAAQLADFAPLGLLCEVHRHVLRDETEVARAAMRHLERLRGQQHVSAHVTALAHLGLGDHASALHWLGVAVEERSPWMAYMDVDPRLDALRSNPRFAAIRARATPLE